MARVCVRLSKDEGRKSLHTFHAKYRDLSSRRDFVWFIEVNNMYEGHIKPKRQTLKCSFRAFRLDACDA